MGILTHIGKSSDESQLSYFDKAAGQQVVEYERTSGRPADGFLAFHKEEETVTADKINTIRYRDLWNLSRLSDIHQLIFNTRARKTFRGGYAIEPLFERANKGQKKEIEQWIRKCNNNNQSLTEVFKEIDKDLNWADDAFLCCLKDYGYNEYGQIVQADVKEFVRLHPLSVELVLDNSRRLGRYWNEHNDTKGGESRLAYFDPKHRQVLTPQDKCPKTGRQFLQAHYRVNTTEGYTYYNMSEIMHKSAFNPSLTYGYSPMFSQYQKTLILMFQDSYIKKYYGDDKPTKGLLVFNTQNKQALMKTFEELRLKTQKDPHGVKPIIAESNDGRKPVEYIDMGKTLNEMNYTATREEIRQQIGAMYGVSTMFMNDMSSGGGLNNEGLQITITNEVIEDRQALFNESFLKFVFEDNLGLVDWDITIKPDIEQDLMAEEQLEAQELANVETKLRLGLKGKMDDNGDFKFYGGDLQLEEPAQDEFIPFNMGKSVSKSASTPKIEHFQKADESEKPIPADAKELDKKLNQELTKIFDELDLPKDSRPKESTLLKAVGRVSKRLEKQLRKAGASVFKGIYERIAKETSKELGVKMEMTESDKELLDTLKESDTYKEAFTNLSLANSDRVRETIFNAFSKDSLDINSLVKDLEQDLDATKGNLRTIVRTESGKVASASRRQQLVKTGNDYVYQHIGPSDNRETQTSKNITRRTKNGVSWEDYLKIMKEESAKEFPKWSVDDNAPLSHYNSRHTFLFKRVGVNK